MGNQKQCSRAAVCDALCHRSPRRFKPSFSRKHHQVEKYNNKFFLFHRRVLFRRIGNTVIFLCFKVPCPDE